MSIYSQTDYDKLFKIESYESQEINRSYDEFRMEVKCILTGKEDIPLVVTENSVLAEEAFFDWLETYTPVQGLTFSAGLLSTKVKHVGGGVHEATAIYVQNAPEVVKVIRYRSTGQSARIIQGYGSVYSVAANPNYDPEEPVGPGNQPTGSGPDFKGLIGVTRDGVEGVDVPVPSFSFSVDLRFSAVDQAYLSLCHRLTGCVNNVACLGFDPGELLFLGIEGEIGMTSGGAIKLSASPISFLFDASPNVTDLVVGPFTIPAKQGWDYLWPRTVEEATSETVIRRTKSVHIDRVLRRADLNQLGI
jgi:hypothetical protein